MPYFPLLLELLIVYNIECQVETYNITMFVKQLLHQWQSSYKFKVVLSAIYHTDESQFSTLDSTANQTIQKQTFLNFSFSLNDSRIVMIYLNLLAYYLLSNLHRSCIWKLLDYLFYVFVSNLQKLIYLLKLGPISRKLKLKHLNSNQSKMAKKILTTN